jgi:dolichol-phosphate mannosyltransferase
MPELALHFSVVFALVAPRLGVKRALLLSFIALVPDLDVLMHVHRSMSHSILILAFAYTPILLAVYRFKPKGFRLALLGLLALLSHPVMDCFQTYTPILYPLLDRSVWLSVDGGVWISPSGLKPFASAGVKDTPTVFKRFTTMDAPVFTGEGFLISLLLVAVPLAVEFKACSSKSVRRSVEMPLDGPAESLSVAEPTVAKDMVTVVIPTLNEEEAIGKVLDELRAEGYRNILVVDGYSSDGTVEVAKQKGVEVVLQHGAGKAGAIRTALEHVKTPYMVVMDGDYTYDPKDIERMLVHAAKYDEIIGVRANSKNIGWLHRLGNKIINIAFNLLLGASLSDVCSGMYLVKTEALRGVELRSRGFSVEVEIAAHMCSSGRVTEVPISYRRRVGRRKLKSLRDGFSILSTVFWLARSYNPVFLFAVLASLMAVPGVVLTLWQLYLRYVYGAEAWSMGVAWLGLFLLVVGVQGFTVATIALLLKRMEKRIVQSLKGSGGS